MKIAHKIFSCSFSLILISFTLSADSDEPNTDNEIQITSPVIPAQEDSSKNSLSTTKANGWCPDNNIDCQLSLKAQNALRGGFLSRGYENVSVFVRDGEATIVGYVDSENARNDVLNRIHDIDDIYTIKDLLSLDEQLSSKDRQLTLRARETLKGGVVGRSYENILVNVQDGHAIVKGTVNSDSDRRDIMRRIMHIDAIKAVDNQITVSEIKPAAR